MGHVKCLSFFLVLAALLSAAILALADEAQDITKECTFDTCYTYSKPEMMTDGKYTTSWKSQEVVQPYVIVNTPTGIPCYGAYILFCQNALRMVH